MSAPVRFGLIGKPLAHSFSVSLHRRLGTERYELIELEAEELGPFLERRDFAGLNVTLPYKRAVLPYLDELTPRAAAVGAVNTVVNRGGRLLGDNTDLGGLCALLRRVTAAEGKRVRILGTGGASRAAVASANALGAAEVLRLSRTGREGALRYDAPEAFPEGAVLINATPCGMAPRAEERPLNLERLPRPAAVVDLIYNPLRSRLVQQAQRLGIPGEGGLSMLVVQAILAEELFQNRRFPLETAERLFRETLEERENLVLIGMPGSGKSTLGRLLAEGLEKPFYDTDALLEARTGRSIREWFAQRGEADFREAETALLRELCADGGAVIATGGGAVLREENRRLLRQNGRVLLLERPLADLRPGGDRPLADSAEKLARLFEERMPLYRAAADRTFPVEGRPEDAAARIIREIEEDYDCFCHQRAQSESAGNPAAGDLWA